jgi:hypothetical protein
MKPLLIALAERIGWSKTDIDLDLLITYYREKLMNDNNATNTRQQLNKSNPATQILRHFVDLRYKIERATDRNKTVIILDTRLPLDLAFSDLESLADFWHKQKERFQNDDDLAKAMANASYYYKLVELF